VRGLPGLWPSPQEFLIPRLGHSVVRPIARSVEKRLRRRPKLETATDTGFGDEYTIERLEIGATNGWRKAR